MDEITIDGINGEKITVELVDLLPGDVMFVPSYEKKFLLMVVRDGNTGRYFGIKFNEGGIDGLKGMCNDVLKNAGKKKDLWRMCEL